MNDVWHLVHAERRALIYDLRGLSASQWQMDSLCSQWTVHDVAAHLIDNAKTTRLGFARGLLRARFDFDQINARGVDRERGYTPAQTLSTLAQVAQRTSGPPAAVESRLVEEVVHGEDIRRPLGIHRAYPSETVLRALFYQARTPASFGGARELLTTVHVRATDGSVRLGSGAEVSGPLVSLLLVLTGRSAAVDDLDGPGVAYLA
ncbi:MAG: maleylpyruvate isomerase family mycothiol-dependent enzyme [Ornithinimicrobium sp.]